MFAAIPKQITSTIEAQRAARLDLYTAFNTKALDTINKLTELNLHAMQNLLARAPAFEPPTPDNLFAPWTVKPVQQQQPGFNQALDYGRHLTQIVLDAGNEYLRMMQPGMASTQQQFTQQFEGLARQAPASGAGFLDVLRNALGTANDSYNNLVKASEQAAEAISASNGATPPAQPKTTKSGKRPAAS